MPLLIGLLEVLEQFEKCPLICRVKIKASSVSTRGEKDMGFFGEVSEDHLLPND
ncbi:MAG: hypothetical protein CM15mP49_25610 [Actinomycetota bacterium]|nr:MAG: hypothetical protein CM15mP49_25610 [Actinomycetota bacterium]